MKKILSILLTCIVLLGGCGGKNADPEQQSSEAANSSGEMVIIDGDGENDEKSSADSSLLATEESSGEEGVISNEDMFTKRDSRVTYEDVQTTIHLNGSSASCDSSNVHIEGSVITITDEGTYIVEGTLDDGMIIVDAEETDKPQIVLKGASINCSDSAPIYILEADKVFITLEADTENVLSNGGVFESIDENNMDAVIFSKQDLTLNGSGSLTVTSPAGHGIVSKDDLVMTGGSYVITSASHGVDANDSVRIVGASMNIAAGKDGIHAENTEDETKGFVYIENGGFDITAEGDGISAGAYMQIMDGTFNLLTGGGSVNAAKQTSDSWGMMGGGKGPGGFGGPGGMGGHRTADTQTDSTSMKGMKAGGSLLINGGTMDVDSADDAIHANGSVVVNGGTFTIKTGDDAVHADEVLTVTNCDMTVSESYEGLEAQKIYVTGGDLHLVTTDDGINAA
ncbi:MAG: carbohydrate-binding domain-containing protein, partial [Firmicutes bacterium]|nr:carbohydrate-binding domain-containing protein [Bacillota bacterium]